VGRGVRGFVFHHKPTIHRIGGRVNTSEGRVTEPVR
jgi:hypothetical protein